MKEIDKILQKLEENKVNQTDLNRVVANFVGFIMAKPDEKHLRADAIAGFRRDSGIQYYEDKKAIELEDSGKWNIVWRGLEKDILAVVKKYL